MRQSHVRRDWRYHDQPSRGSFLRSSPEWNVAVAEPRGRSAEGSPESDLLIVIGVPSRLSATDIRGLTSCGIGNRYSTVPWHVKSAQRSYRLHSASETQGVCHRCSLMADSAPSEQSRSRWAPAARQRLLATAYRRRFT